MNDPRMTSEASLVIPVEGIFDLPDEPVLSDLFPVYGLLEE
jgi:hypothetical protein